MAQPTGADPAPLPAKVVYDPTPPPPPPQPLITPIKQEEETHHLAIVPTDSLPSERQLQSLPPKAAPSSPPIPSFIDSINELRQFSAALSDFHSCYDDLITHISSVGSAIESQLNSQTSKITLPTHEILPVVPVNEATSTPPSIPFEEKEKQGEKEKEVVKPKQSELEGLCLMMASRGLRKYMVTHLREANKLREEVPKALKLAHNPAKLVLDCVGRFFLQGKKAYTKDSPMITAREASVLTLECFLLAQCDNGIGRMDKELREMSEKAARGWRKRLISEGGLAKASEIDARGLLLFIGCFGIPLIFKIENFRDLIRAGNVKEIASVLTRSSVLMTKISEIIESMVKMKMAVDAVDIAYTFGLEDKVSPEPILTSFLRDAKEIWKRTKRSSQGSFTILNEANKKYLTTLQSVIKCLECHKIDSLKVLPGWPIWVLALWIGVMAGLFAYKYVQYKNRSAYDVMGVCVCLAKGGAETLKLNMALILLPVCRNTITWLRNKTRLGAAVPFDDNLNFHKVIAVAIAIGVGIHVLAHVTCDFPRLLHASPEKYKPLEQYFGEQPTSYWHFVKGVEGITGIIMVVLMAIAFTLATPWFRRNKLNLPKPLDKLTGFNAFWYSHHLFVIVYALLIVHGIKLYLTHEWYKKTTWMYVAVPIALYAGERLIRAFRSSVKPVKILKVAVYPGNVLALHMSKPHGFKYRSGQYMFVNCAAVSPFEWHPFSITSAPRDDYLSVHIRTLGDWTRQLRTVFSEVCQPPPTGKSGLLRFESDGESFQGGMENNPNFPRVLIDGPYGAPAQDYKKYDVVLLVGLGIGATPMISIVKDIVNNMKAIEEEEHALENGGTGSPVLPPNRSPITNTRKVSGSGNGGNFKTKRAYFYWVTREQGSFDWFKGIMNEVAETDKKGVIEMHNYCTSVYEEGDARSALITMLQSLNHAKNGVDIVSGTRVKSHFAKPNWRNVYKRIALNHTNSRVGVFYCGAPALTKDLKQLASDFSRKTSTKFDFHKENF